MKNTTRHLQVEYLVPGNDWLRYGPIFYNMASYHNVLSELVAVFERDGITGVTYRVASVTVEHSVVMYVDPV